MLYSLSLRVTTRIVAALYIFVLGRGLIVFPGRVLRWSFPGTAGGWDELRGRRKGRPVAKAGGLRSMRAALDEGCYNSQLSL